MILRILIVAAFCAAAHYFYFEPLSAQTPTPAKCGTQVSGMPQVLQFSDNNCLAVPPGPTTGTCWIQVANSVPTFQCADGTIQKFSLTTWP